MSWENGVIAEVAKRNALLGPPAQLFFWRSRAQSEVGLVEKRADDLQAFEIFEGRALGIIRGAGARSAARHPRSIHPQDFPSDDAP